MLQLPALLLAIGPLSRDSPHLLLWATFAHALSCQATVTTEERHALKMNCSSVPVVLSTGGSDSLAWVMPGLQNWLRLQQDCPTLFVFLVLLPVLWSQPDTGLKPPATGYGRCPLGSSLGLVPYRLLTFEFSLDPII